MIQRLGLYVKGWFPGEARDPWPSRRHARMGHRVAFNPCRVFIGWL